MLATSNEIIAAWLNHSRQLSIRVKIDSVTYGSEEITSLSFDSGSISGEVFQIGSTYMNSVQIVFPSIIESIAEDIEVIPELGVMVNGSYEYTKLGHFFIDDFDRNKNNQTTSITATDKMRFMEGEYVSKLTYPKAYREVALDVANSAGVEVNTNSFASLGIGAINQPEGYTHRQAIGLIAQFEGGFASFNRNGELEIRRLAPTTFEITPESYLLKGFTKNEASYRIGGISVKTGEEETDVITVGSTNGSQVELENKVMTKTLLNKMWELVKTLNYFPYELKWRGCPPLEAGDWIYISDKDGNKYSVPNLSYSITFNGGMSAESKALTSSTSQATYKYRGSLNQRIDYLNSVLSANKWNTNYYDQTEPSNPKEGDIWFKPNGQDTEIWIYRNVDGVLKWVMEITSAGDPELLAAIEDAKQAGQDAQLAAEDAKTAADDAKIVGEAAQQAANDAKQAGDTAISLANQADIDAKAAKAKADAIQIDVNGLVSDVATINGTVTSISSKANEAYAKANAVEGRTSTLETSVTGLTGRMTDIESTSTSTKKKLNELVVTVDGQKQTLATTTTTANSALSKANVLETTVDGVKTTLTSVQTWQDNLSISGRNLVRKTGFENNEHPFTGIIGNPERGLETVDGVLAYKIQHSNSSSTPQGVYFAKSSLTIPPAIGDTFVFSMIVKGTGLFFSMRFEQADNSKTLGGTAIPTEWTRVYITGVHTGTSGAFIIYIRENSVLYIKEKSLKIESGTISTDWSPAPEDLSTVSKVNQISDTVDGHTQLIASTKTTANSALTKANTAQSTADGNTTKITAVTTTANSALSKANTLEETVDGVTRTISQVESDLNGLEIGGRNYAKNSRKTFELSNVTNNGGRMYGDIPYNLAYLAGKTVTVSVEIEAKNPQPQNPAGNFRMGCELSVPLSNGVPYYLGIWTFFTVGVDVPKQRISRTVIIPADIKSEEALGLHLYVQANGDYFKVSNPKIEIGNKETDWTPAPEDMATASQFTQLSDQIDLRVQKNGVINAINVSTEGVVIAGNKITITGTTTIASAVIKTAHIADLAVSNGKIANLAVTEGKIGNLAVTNAKIADLAVTTAKIGDAAITNAKIGDLAVSTAKIADAAITDAKIGNLSATKITTGTLNAANVNIVNLNANSISTGELTGINIRAATFYGSSGSGNMQLNGVDLRFDTSSNSFRLNYNGIVNVNTSYGTRALAFFNEGINIAASSSNSGNFRNSGLTLSGDSTYVDFYSIGSTSANGRLLYSGNSMTLNNFITGKRISLANNFDLYVSSLNVHKTNDSDWSGVYAASFTNSSERRLKTNLVLLKDSLSVLQKMKFYEYDRIDTLQHQLGPVLDEAPEKIIQGQGIDQYSFITLVATSLQEHAKKTSQDIDMLALKIDNLQNEFNQLRNAS